MQIEILLMVGGVPLHGRLQLMGIIGFIRLCSPRVSSAGAMSLHEAQVIDTAVSSHTDCIPVRYHAFNTWQSTLTE